MENNDELDRTIDSALAGYSDAEPLAGLEERVLNRVRLAEVGRRKALGWAVVIAVAASVVIAAIVLLAPRHSDPKTYIVGIPARPAPAAEKPLAAPRPRGRIATKRAPSPKLLRKEEQFPTPAPMTAEERALVAFVGQHPAEARQIFAERQQRSDEPIKIQPIEIPPLRSDGAQ